MILCGLWFGEVKPFMNLFTKPFTKSLKQLETICIDYEVDGTSYLTKGYLICGTADLPAKSIVLNCNQFNGKYSCMRCMHPGETFKTNKGGCVHTFPYDASKPQFDKRTFQSCIEHAFTAIRDQKTTNGIKGPSFLMALKSYDFVKSNSIDYMHGVLLGITKLLIKLWISSGFSDQKFSVSKYVEIIDERLLQIKPPSFITRIPRTLSDHFKYWKASELRSWLYYYSLPVMFDILTPAYLMHYACFVQGIYLLSTDCVTTDDLKMSQSLLSYFVHMFPSLYGERYVTLNMHSLLHLTECVEDLGPLWVYSCFPFENINGVLMELFHGTQNVELQIISSVNVLQNMPDVLRNIDDPTILKFIEKMKHKNLHHKIPAGTLSGSCPIGAGSNINLTEDLFGKLVTEVNFKPSKVFTYKRISHRGLILHSAA
ncbi:Hypothetical predicted protein [Mytilus galloprovincialis]|uniref:DUF4218 domain-containing protein n=1 Tax=Mytilus galloprovincialis TaxID=29158 RepID=A0A8B6GIK6_MYTGA|nr:Hypothetical predicted protein [Mytilus galloprovincialis]